MRFYLDQLKDVEAGSAQLLLLSPATICLCLAAIIPAENRYRWVQDLTDLEDSEWAEAVIFLSTAWRELRGQTAQIDGGQADSLSIFEVNGGTAFSSPQSDLDGGGAGG